MISNPKLVIGRRGFDFFQHSRKTMPASPKSNRPYMPNMTDSFSPRTRLTTLPEKDSTAPDSSATSRFSPSRAVCAVPLPSQVSRHANYTAFEKRANGERAVRRAR